MNELVGMNELTKKQKVAVVVMALALATVILMLTGGVYAAAAAKDVLEVIHKVLKYLTVIVGSIVLLSGIVKYVMAKQDSNGPDEHKAIMTMAVGVILIILFTVIIDDNVMSKIAGWIDSADSTTTN